MSNILVTGATGFLGGHVVKRLVYEGVNVTAIGRNKTIGNTLPKDVRFLQVSLEDRQRIFQAMQHQDFVIHFGALSSVWGKYENFYNSNVIGTQNIVDAALSYNVKRFVHVSTPSIYFNLQERTKVNVKENSVLPNPAINFYADVKSEDSILTQLGKENIHADDIHYIFLSHFHADHMCALNDFPKSKFICSKEAYLSVKNKKGVSAVKSAFIPNLLPTDFEQRVFFIEDSKIAQISSQSIKTIEEVFQKPLYDIWGDGSCLAINLSGHAKGQLGLIFENDKSETIFLVADAVWRSVGFRENRPPSKGNSTISKRCVLRLAKLSFPFIKYLALWVILFLCIISTNPFCFKFFLYLF